MRFLVTGAKGLLGSEVSRAARARGHQVTNLDHAALDVTDRRAVLRTIERSGPDVVVHCAAYTAVDLAESEPGRAATVNRDGAGHVADAAAAVRATLVHISSDYVFDGTKRLPYLPSDAPRPLSVYGRTKWEAEVAVGSSGADALIARMSWLYGREGGFVAKILQRARRGEELRVVNDQVGRPTWVRNAAGVVLDLLDRHARGIWHVGDGETCTWMDLAVEVVRLRGLAPALVGVSSAEFGAPAPRPSYSVLAIRDTEELLGRRMMPWREALARCLSEAGDMMEDRTT